MRARLWHRDLFERLNEEALDAEAVTRGRRPPSGLEAVDTGLFDIPPFPDTSVPLAKLLRARRGKDRCRPERSRGDAGVGVVDPALPHGRRPGDGGPGGPPVTLGAVPPGADRSPAWPTTATCCFAARVADAAAAAGAATHTQ